MDTKNPDESPVRVWPPPGMFQCPKEDCPRLFTSREAMEAHQMSYETHALCMACNIQFMTQEELFLHQLVSKRHHNCPICNRSFHTDDGRDFHIQQDHREDQGLACPGCHKTFNSGKSYKAHITTNKCNSPAVMALNKHNERRERMKKILHEAEQAGPMSPFVSDDDNYRDSSSGTEDLGLSDPFDEAEGQDDIKRFWHSERTPSPSRSCDSSPDDSGAFAAPTLPVPGVSNGHHSHSPVAKPQISTLPFLPRSFPISPDDLIAYDDDLDDDWPSSPSVCRMPDKDQYPESSPVSHPQAIRKLIPNWDSEKHWNSESKRYFCSCGFTTPFVKIFEQHVVIERTGVKRSCTHCGKNYANTAALFTHIEKNHIKETTWTPKTGEIEREKGVSFGVERRLDTDGSFDFQYDFQIYDRSPIFNQPNSRPHSKAGFGWQSTKLPKGTFW